MFNKSNSDCMKIRRVCLYIYIYCMTVQPLCSMTLNFASLPSSNRKKFKTILVTSCNSFVFCSLLVFHALFYVYLLENPETSDRCSVHCVSIFFFIERN